MFFNLQQYKAMLMHDCLVRRKELLQGSHVAIEITEIDEILIDVLEDRFDLSATYKGTPIFWYAAYYECSIAVNKIIDIFTQDKIVINFAPAKKGNAIFYLLLALIEKNTFLKADEEVLIHALVKEMIKMNADFNHHDAKGFGKNLPYENISTLWLATYAGFFDIVLLMLQTERAPLLTYDLEYSIKTEKLNVGIAFECNAEKNIIYLLLRHLNEKKLDSIILEECIKLLVDKADIVNEPLVIDPYNTTIYFTSAFFVTIEFGFMHLAKLMLPSFFQYITPSDDMSDYSNYINLFTEIFSYISSLQDQSYLKRGTIAIACQNVIQYLKDTEELINRKRN